jgi:hypothetical protein
MVYVLVLPNQASQSVYCLFSPFWELSMFVFFPFKINNPSSNELK